ncbi:MAG TPA: ATP-binding cassette domain-containing protein, partial [Candidatus Flavonifractor intestinigallinarum]|nr:ATP-binding cassette domain-containing protein [Candidatus Flavonifractor intestinigallinarum]
GMYEYREHAPHLLSGGQKQRVAIAGVIAMQPRCIVLDEPTAMLDPIGRSEVLKTIKQLNRTSGVTVVLITHHMDEAAQADRLVVMSKGKVIADGVPRDVFKQVEKLKEVGLTVPETTELLWELQKAGVDVSLDALSDEECAQTLYQLLNQDVTP